MTKKVFDQIAEGLNEALAAAKEMRAGLGDPKTPFRETFSAEEIVLARWFQDEATESRDD